MITFSSVGNFGRFGNQLFQIASTIGIGTKYGVVAKFYGWEYSKFFKNPIDQTLMCSDIKFTYTEPHFHYTDVPYRPGMDLMGYFQSEKYFMHCKELILSHFDFVDGIIGQNELDEAKECCSIHVRRTDYVNLAEYHPFPGMQYYMSAISEMETLGIKKFKIFSDDIPWCMSAFGNDKKFTYLVGNSNVYDMCMMSNCHSNILANSSFSWWGAWLNKNQDKHVIAPSLWFGPSNGHADTKDLYCDGWKIR